MGIATLAKYLVGNRQAILEIATTPRAVRLGLLLVLSAGFAREYDGEDLWHEPWHLLLPLAASLLTAVLLFGLLWLVFPGWQFSSSLGKAFRSFLSLYWMTAPLAWLYAIPVERLLTAEGATRANLWLLGIVAIWRVALMIRVVSVLGNVPVWKAFFPVMLFADTVTLVLLSLTPLPIISIMGGIRLTESEQLLQTTAFLVEILAGASWPVWVAGVVMVVKAGGRKRLPLAATDGDRKVTRGAWCLAAAAILVGVGVLPLTQPEQQLRYAVERDLRGGRIPEALTTMSHHDPDEFPPLWDPPPRVAYRNQHPPLLDIMEALPHAQASPWVVATFREKFISQLDGYSGEWFWQELDESSFDRYLTVTEVQFAGSADVEAIRFGLETQLSEYARSSTEQRARIRKLLGDESHPMN